MRTRIKPLFGLLFSLTAQFIPAITMAADYPERPIKMVVPFPPGGATDVVSRLMETGSLSSVIENRGGAGAVIGAEVVAKAAPDGYTILSTTAGVHVVNPAIYPQLPYDPIKSFSPVGQSISAPLVIAVPTSSPFKTLKDFLAYAKKNPGQLNYGTAGTGSSLHQT